MYIKWDDAVKVLLQNVTTHKRTTLFLLFRYQVIAFIKRHLTLGFLFSPLMFPSASKECRIIIDRLGGGIRPASLHVPQRDCWQDHTSKLFSFSLLIFFHKITRHSAIMSSPLQLYFSSMNLPAQISLTVDRAPSFLTRNVPEISATKRRHHVNSGRWISHPTAPSSLNSLNILLRSVESNCDRCDTAPKKPTRRGSLSSDCSTCIPITKSGLLSPASPLPERGNTYQVEVVARVAWTFAHRVMLSRVGVTRTERFSSLFIIKKANK